MRVCGCNSAIAAIKLLKTGSLDLRRIKRIWNAEQRIELFRIIQYSLKLWELCSDVEKKLIRYKYKHLDPSSRSGLVAYEVGQDQTTVFSVDELLKAWNFYKKNIRPTQKRIKSLGGTLDGKIL